MNDIPYIPFVRPDFTSYEHEAITRVLLSPWLSTGPETEEFEQKFADYIGTDFAIAVNSGTTALEYSVMATMHSHLEDRYEHGGEIILPSFTFVASANAIVRAGFTPRFVDIDPETYCLSTDNVDDAINSNTVGIMPVHLFGCPAEMIEIIDIADECDLAVIEDCAQACGASIHGNMVGSIGDAGTFSFTAGKNMTMGEGGMVTTNNVEIAEFIRLIRNHGFKPGDNLFERNSIFPGDNRRMCNILAAIGLVQLDRLDAMNSKRICNATHLYEELLNLENIHIQPVHTPNSTKNVYWVYNIFSSDLSFTDGNSIQRDGLLLKLRLNNIQAMAYFTPPCHQQTYFSNTQEPNRSRLSWTESAAANIINLPVYPGLTDEELDYMVSIIKKLDKECA